MGFPSVQNGAFLPGCRELLVVWGHDFYVLDPEARKIGLLARGSRFTLRDDSFRCIYEPHSGWWPEKQDNESVDDDND